MTIRRHCSNNSPMRCTVFFRWGPANLRKLAEAGLQRYRHAVDTFHEMIVVVDREYRYVMANQAFLNYHGLKREQVVGHFVSELVGQERFEKVTKSNVDECFQGRVVKCEMGLDFPQLGRRDLFG